MSRDWSKKKAANLKKRVKVRGVWVSLVPGLKHGTSNSYNYYGCHCFDCTKWMADYYAKYRR